MSSVRLELRPFSLESSILPLSSQCHQMGWVVKQPHAIVHQGNSFDYTKDYTKNRTEITVYYQLFLGRFCSVLLDGYQYYVFYVSS